MKKSTYDILEHEQIDSLYENGESISSLSKRLSHAPRLIKEFLNLKGIDIRKQGIYDIELSIKYYKNGKTLKELANLFKVDVGTIKRNLIANGIKIVRQNSMYDLNGKIFDNIDTEEKAYWLGFIFADGNISKSRPSFEMNLQYSDIKHLEKLTKFLNYNKKIRKQIQGNSVVCRIKVDNKNLWNSLNKYGCTPNKSLTVKFPNINIFTETETLKREILIKHFIRGFVDGNGSITHCGGNRKDRKNIKYYPELIIISTKNFLEELIKHLPLENSASKIYKHVNINSIILTNKQAYNCMKYLYEGATIYLDRKYNKYLEFRRFYEKS